MKTLKLIRLLIFILFYQVAFSQNENIVKSFNLLMPESVEKGLDNTAVAKALNIQFQIPESYEFKRQIIKGTKDKTSEKDDLGYVHERYAQYYKGIKIEHSDIRVHYLDGLFVSANGEYIDASNIDISIVLSKENAIQKAIEHIGAKKYMWEDEAENNWLKSITNNETTSFYPNPEIVICKNSINTQDTAFHIAYKIDIYAKEPIRHDYVYVNAKTGEVLDVRSLIYNSNFVDGSANTRYSGTQTISTEYFEGSYRLRGSFNNIKINTYDQKNLIIEEYFGDDFRDNNNNWTSIEYNNATKDNGALDAHWGMMMASDYFKKVHGRNSYNGNGITISSFVHYGGDYSNNAFFDGNFKIFGFGDGDTETDILTSLDIVAHEFGHGVCLYSANLTYQKESGAICESLSDIWGACVEKYVAPNKNMWFMGEDIDLSSSVNKGNRCLSNPKLKEQPDTYGGTYWINTNNCTPNRDNDLCGVHRNSGVMNYWFYLLVEGGSGTNDINNNYNVTGIGIEKASKIIYRAETVYMTQNTNYNLARACTMLAAADLYGECSPEMISVVNSWYAVGVGSSINNNQTYSNKSYNSNTTINAVNCNDIVLYNVSVGNNSKLTINAKNNVLIDGEFEVKPGAEFEINIIE